MLWSADKLPTIEGVHLSKERLNKKTTQKAFIVAIDPGHGGEDRGARNKYNEKDIVLEIAIKTVNILKHRKNITPVLTRKNDYFLSIKHRCKIAHYNRSDILVSIHANANNDSSVHGTSVYFLSPGSASNRASKLIASRENASDLIEGFSYSEDNISLDTTLVNLMQKNSLRESEHLSKILFDSLVKKTERKALGIFKADFGVLKVPDITSVLMETAFITNREEEELLVNSIFQDKVALAIADAITEYTKELEGRFN